MNSPSRSPSGPIPHNFGVCRPLNLEKSTNGRNYLEVATAFGAMILRGACSVGCKAELIDPENQYVKLLARRTVCFAGAVSPVLKAMETDQVKARLLGEIPNTLKEPRQVNGLRLGFRKERNGDSDEATGTAGELVIVCNTLVPETSQLLEALVELSGLELKSPGQGPEITVATLCTEDPSAPGQLMQRLLPAIRSIDSNIGIPFLGAHTYGTAGVDRQ